MSTLPDKIRRRDLYILCIIRKKKKHACKILDPPVNVCLVVVGLFKVFGMIE